MSWTRDGHVSNATWQNGEGESWAGGAEDEFVAHVTNIERTTRELRDDEKRVRPGTLSANRCAAISVQSAVPAAAGSSKAIAAEISSLAATAINHALAHRKAVKNSTSQGQGGMYTMR